MKRTILILCAILLAVDLLAAGEARVRVYGQATRRQEGVQDDKERLRDITGIEHLPARREHTQWVAWLVLGCVALGILAVAGWKLGRRSGQKASEPPARRARNELDRLDSLDLSAAEARRQFLVALAEILRRYLEQRFQLPATYQTTPEFVASMRRVKDCSSSLIDLLRDLLEQCDLAKFARADFPPNECQRLSRQARDLVGEMALDDSKGS